MGGEDNIKKRLDDINIYFVDICDSLNMGGGCSGSNLNFIDEVMDTIFLVSAHPGEIYRFIKNLKNTTSLGVDRIPVTFLKDHDIPLAPLISGLVNKCFELAQPPILVKAIANRMVSSLSRYNIMRNCHNLKKRSTTRAVF